MTKPLTTVVLDIDGTLLDSNDAHASAWRAALADAGVDVDLSRIRRLIGMGGDQLLAELGLTDDSGPGKAATARRKEIFLHRLLPSLQPFTGTRALLERMAEEGLQRVVATSAAKDEVDHLLAQAGVDDLVLTGPGGDQVPRAKPAPDVVAAALFQASAPPDQAVMIGDTPYDLEAAARAGVPMIAFRCGGWSFEQGGPVAIFDDPADLLLRWDTSPLASR